MKVLVVALLVSVAALLLVAIAAARHVWRQRNLLKDEIALPGNEKVVDHRTKELDKALK